MGLNSRRRFLKKLGLFTASSFLAHNSFASIGSQQSHSQLANGDKSSESYWELVKQSFHIEKDLIYLNNGTLGPSPSIVEQAVINRITSVNSDLRYGGGEDVRDAIGKLIKAKGSEISLTHNTTEGINVAAWGLPLGKKDEVIITSHEHVGNAMPWVNRASHDGLVIKTFEPKKTGSEILNQIDALITKRTRVISIPHISCTIGQNFPVKEVCKLAREKGIYSVIDGAHGAGGLDLNMAEIKPDVYVTCGHKWLLGPKGTGFLYVSEHLFDKLRPVFAGAYTDSGFDITVSPATFNGYSETAHRYDYGTQNSALKYGLKAAVDFNLEIGADVIQNRIFELNEYLYSQLVDLSSIEMLSSQEQKSRSMMLGFRHRSIEYKDVFSKMLKAHYRIRQVPESQVNCLRVSTHIYNTKSQIDGFVETLKKLS